MKTTRVPLAIFGLLVGVAVLAPGTTSLSASFGRSGFLQVEKECSEYQGQPGQFSTITLSDISEITPGSKVFYTQPAGIPAACWTATWCSTQEMAAGRSAVARST